MRKRGMIAGVVGATIVAATAIRGVVRRFEIKEDSMSPTLADGDWVIAKRASGQPERGDIIVFGGPGRSEKYLVKRVIGLGWEQVGIDSGRVTINGAVLADRWANGTTEPSGEWTVPEGHVWVLGDNRGASTSDSRTVGPVAVDDIRWIVVGTYWPTSRAGRVEG